MHRRALWKLKTETESTGLSLCLISVMQETTGFLYAIRTNPHLLRAAQITEQLGGLHSCISMSVTALGLPSGASLACRPIIQAYQLHSSVHAAVCDSVCASFLHLECAGPARPAKVRLQDAPVVSLAEHSCHPGQCCRGTLSSALISFFHGLFAANLAARAVRLKMQGSPLHCTAQLQPWSLVPACCQQTVTQHNRKTDRAWTCLQLVTAYPFKMDDRNTQVQHCSFL